MPKIVRDKIPEIILDNGDVCKTKRVSDNEAIEYLIRKVIEEIGEFRESGKVEELADVLEVLSFISAKLGIDWSEVEGLRHKKFEERGGFSQNIILLEVEDK